MYLSRLKIKRFRSCQNTEVRFSPLVTVLVGENGSGKSAIIDAIRLAVMPASGRRFYYWQESRDLSYGSQQGEKIEIQQVYEDLSEYEKSAYIEKLTDETDDLVYTVDFDTRRDIPYGRRVGRYIGSAKVQDPDVFSLQRIGYVYLPPLRDATREFDSVDGNRLSEVMVTLARDGEIEEFRDVGNDAMRSIAGSTLVTRTLSSIQSHLSRVTHPTRKQEVQIGYRQQDIRKLARYLRLQMAESGYDPGDLTSSGLGYANLLFIASVILELEHSGDRDLTLVLVEEPEAHLHPQLQMVLLDYLRAKAEATAQGNPGNKPAGRIQVVVTTHSPNIASAVSTDDIVVINTFSSSGRQTQGHVRISTCVALRDSDLSASQRRKIDRYLNVTRSSLLFARRVILVEGLAEAILLQQIADRCVLRPHRLPGVKPDKVELWREAFAAISIVSIDSVDFEPYLRLLLGGPENLVDRLVVLTDNDNGPGLHRKDTYEKGFGSAIRSKVLSVHVGHATLEADILAESANEPLIKKCYLELHGRSGQKWDRILSGAPESLSERAMYIAASMKENVAENRLSFEKGEFSQILCEELSDTAIADQFVVPGYIKSGILDVVR